MGNSFSISPVVMHPALPSQSCKTKTSVVTTPHSPMSSCIASQASLLPLSRSAAEKNHVPLTPPLVDNDGPACSRDSLHGVQILSPADETDLVFTAAARSNRAPVSTEQRMLWETLSPAATQNIVQVFAHAKESGLLLSLLPTFFANGNELSEDSPVNQKD